MRRAMASSSAVVSGMEKPAAGAGAFVHQVIREPVGANSLPGNKFPGYQDPQGVPIYDITAMSDHASPDERIWNGLPQ